MLYTNISNFREYFVIYFLLFVTLLDFYRIIIKNDKNMKNLIKPIITKITLILLLILTVINTFSQSKIKTNREYCENSSENWEDWYPRKLTQDSSYHIFIGRNNLKEISCVFKVEKTVLKEVKYVYDTSYYNNFIEKFTFHQVNHFITKKIGYKQFRINNIKEKRMSDKYVYSRFYKTYNSGVNWELLVDLDVLDKEYYHEIEKFYCVDSNTIILYGKQLKYKLRTKEFNPNIHEVKLDEYKNSCHIFPNGCLSTWQFNYAEFSTYMFISYNGGKTWNKLNDMFGEDFTDTHRFDVRTQPNLDCFKTGNEELNIDKITHNDKNRQIIISNKKNNRFYVNY